MLMFRAERFSVTMFAVPDLVLFQTQSRDRWEAAARFQNIWNQHTIKYGFEFYSNKYNILQDSTGPNNVFANPNGVGNNNGTDLDNRTVTGFRVTNNFEICTIRATQVVCPLNPDYCSWSRRASVVRRTKS